MNSIPSSKYPRRIELRAGSTVPREGFDSSVIMPVPGVLSL